MAKIPILDGGAFYAADIASIAASGTSAMSAAVSVKNDRTIALQGYFTGSTGGSANVEFQFFGKTKACSKFDTVPYKTITVAANGATEVVASAIVDVSGFDQIKVQIANKDTGKVITAANAYWGSKRIDRRV
jgi:alpha-L-arabinofuranosidase